jgi:hypothetical protein
MDTSTSRAATSHEKTLPSQALPGGSVPVPLLGPESDIGPIPERGIKEYLSDKLEDAERLLKYAAEIGTDVEESTRNNILKARFSDGGITQQTAADLLSALTKLAAKVRPVTAQSLKTCEKDQKAAKSVGRCYILVAAALISFIVPYSIASFVSSGLSERIRQDVVTANALAVKLSDELEPPQTNYVSKDDRGLVKPLPAGVQVKDVITDLQTFASLIRAIDARSRELRHFAANTVPDPYGKERTNHSTMRDVLELPAGLPDLPMATRDRIERYKTIRYFATSNQETVSLIYGAIANHILPMLYALLGACAYLARVLEEQIQNRTLTIVARRTIHFLIAGIGGLVVGLFTNFKASEGVSLSPLALAFLVGYAVDSFFAFLENLLRGFNKGSNNSGSSTAARN